MLLGLFRFEFVKTVYFWVRNWTVKDLQFPLMMLIAGLFVIGCGSGSSDDSGTTGGSGDTESTVAADTDTTADSIATTSTDDDIWLNAFSFDCTSNWTNRDGVRGLTAYSGSGSCSINFPGESGTYKLTLYAVTEFDGQSPYQVSIDGTIIAEGTYPLSSPLGCDCPLDSWSSVCPDTDQTIDLGTHTIDDGDTIEFWGDDVYPCGEHGAYAKWSGIRAVRQ